MKLTKIIKKNKIILSISLFIACLLLLVYLKKQKLVENFSGDNDPYEKDYVDLYLVTYNNTNLFVYDVVKLFEIFENKKYKHFTDKEVNVLEIGSGTGKHLKALYKKYDNTIGLERSGNLINLARKLIKSDIFVQGNATQEELFEPNTFTHIVCLLDTIHHNSPSSMDIIFENMSKWIKSKGLLAIHIFDPNNLDPRPREFSQLHTQKDGNHSITKFKPYNHDSVWLNKKTPNFEFEYKEKFMFNTGKNFNINHILYVPPIETVVQKIKNKGFKLVKKIPLKEVQITNHSLYIFQKD